MQRIIHQNMDIVNCFCINIHPLCVLYTTLSQRGEVLDKMPSQYGEFGERNALNSWHVERETNRYIIK